MQENIDELNLEPAQDTQDDWSNRTWEVIKTVPDGFSIGALFTHRDIALMAEETPSLEGTVFRNKKTGKNYVLKNKRINAKKIIALACNELRSGELSHFVIGLSGDREGVHLLANRILGSSACAKGLFDKYKFYTMMCFYLGERLCK